MEVVIFFIKKFNQESSIFLTFSLSPLIALVVGGFCCVEQRNGRIKSGCWYLVRYVTINVHLNSVVDLVQLWGEAVKNR